MCLGSRARTRDTTHEINHEMSHRSPRLRERDRRAPGGRLRFFSSSLELEDLSALVAKTLFSPHTFSTALHSVSLFSRSLRTAVSRSIQCSLSAAEPPPNPRRPAALTPAGPPSRAASAEFPYAAELAGRT